MCPSILLTKVDIIACARQWRQTNAGDSARKWYYIPLNCSNGSPVCRQHARHVIPSSAFIPHGDQRDLYVAVHNSLKQETPCRYFETSKKRKEKEPTSRIHCPFLNKCAFAHVLEGEKYVFSPTEIRRLKVAARIKA